MVTVGSSLALKKYVTEDGVLTETVTLSEGDYALPFLTSFDGLVLQDNVDLSELNEIKSLSGLVMGVGCSLAGLVLVESLDGLKANTGLTVSGLFGLTDFGMPILAKGCSFSWLEHLSSINADLVMWPQDVCLYGISADVQNILPQWLLNSGRLTIKR